MSFAGGGVAGRGRRRGGGRCLATGIGAGQLWPEVPSGPIIPFEAYAAFGLSTDCLSIRYCALLLSAVFFPP